MMRRLWVRTAACAFATILGCAPAMKPLTEPACMSAIAGQELLTGRIVLLGETHGTTEIPAAFGKLVCHAAAQHRDRTILVGLEIFSDAQAAIDAFLDGDGRPPARDLLLAQEFWQRDYQDGRSSQAMLGLLDELRRYRAAGLKLVVKAMDDPKSLSQQDRDTRMAAALLEAIEAVHPAQTLVLLGDVHSRILPGYPWALADPYLSVGALLREKYDDVVGLHVMSAGGSSWNCLSAVASECGAKPLRAREIAGETPRIELHPEALDKTGWSGALFMGALTASSPAKLDAR